MWKNGSCVGGESQPRSIGTSANAASTPASAAASAASARITDTAPRSVRTPCRRTRAVSRRSRRHSTGWDTRVSSARPRPPRTQRPREARWTVQDAAPWPMAPVAWSASVNASTWRQRAGRRRLRGGSRLTRDPGSTRGQPRRSRYHRVRHRSVGVGGLVFDPSPRLAREKRDRRRGGRFVAHAASGPVPAISAQHASAFAITAPLPEVRGSPFAPNSCDTLPSFAMTLAYPSAS